MNTRRFISCCGMYCPLDDDLEGTIDKLKSNLREMHFSDDLIVETEKAISKYHLELVKDYPEYVNWSIQIKQYVMVNQLISDGFDFRDAYNIINCTPFINLC